MPIPKPTKDDTKTAFKGKSYTSITANMSKLITKDEFEGKEHYVIPTVLIVEGVLNDILYTAAELQKFPQSWNGIPVPVLHTYDEISGLPISANRPRIIEKQSVGRLWNVKYEDRRLKGEIWIDIEKCNRIAPHVLRMLENNQHIEVSTALFTEDELVEGTFDGKIHHYIAHNFRPDHLAILPNEKGACSWEDGAGMPRINKEDKHIDNIRILTRKLAQLQGFIILEEKQVPGEQGKVTNKKGESTMSREKSIDALIANGAWSEDDKDFLAGLEDTQFEKIEKLSLDREVKDSKESEKKTETKAEDKKEDKKSDSATKDKKEVELKDNKDKKEDKVEVKVPATPEEYLATVPEAFKEMIETGLKEHAAKKAKLVADITANKRNPFTEEELESKSIEELAKLKVFAGLEKDYSAQAGAGKPKSNKNESGIIPMPGIDWTK